MRNLIQKLLNWALGYDISASIRALEETSTQRTDEVISIVDTAVTDIMEQWSNELETLNNYDWDDFSQRLDNVQHLEDFSPDDLGEQILALEIGLNHLNEADEANEANDTTELQSQIDDVAHDLKGLEMNQESSDQWFQDFLNRTHEHFMQQAGSKNR